MPTFLSISKHSPENCAMFNEKAKKATFEAVDKLEGHLQKHGVKMVGSWIVPSEHLRVSVYEAPSLEAFNECGMEPEIAALSAFETAEIKLAINMEEAMKMLKEAK